jgi:radical SAM protein with 4Fe4S-binding SPASM domain
MKCPGLPEIDLSQWDVLISRKEPRYPFSGSFELTDRCNLDCVHCYINQPAGSRSVRDKELSTSQAIEILDQAADSGVLFLNLTGGEVMLRSDFTEIYKHAIQRGIIVTLFTNGTLLTPEIADLFAEWRPLSVEISLHGATQESYERVTRLPGSFERLNRGIKLLLERNVPMYLKTTLNTENFHELDSMRAFAEAFGLKYRYDGILWPRINGDPSPFEYQIPMEFLIGLDEKETERRDERSKLAEVAKGRTSRDPYVYRCGAGLTSFHINSAGMMSICIMARKPAYDILEIGFQNAWEKIGQLRDLKRQIVTKCDTCLIRGYCIQCPGWSQLTHNDNESPVEFICEMAHLFAADSEKVYEIS